MKSRRDGRPRGGAFHGANQAGPDETAEELVHWGSELVDGDVFTVGQGAMRRPPLPIRS